MFAEEYNEIILHNRIRCNECGDIIESFTRHDFKCCSCGKCAVDGGKDYLRRCFAYDGVFEELSEVEKVHSNLEDIKYIVFEKGETCRKSDVFNKFHEGLLAYTDNGESITVYCKIISQFLHPHTMTEIINGNINLPKISGRYHFLCIVPQKGFGLKLMRIKCVVDGLNNIHGSESHNIKVFKKEMPGDKDAGYYFVKELKEDEFESVLNDFQVAY